MPPKQLSPAQLSKAFAQMNKRARTARKNAERTLSPDTLMQAVKSGQISPEMQVLIGKRADGTSFTAEDLKGFAKQRERVEKQNRNNGVTIDQLIAASRPDDVKRANGSYQPKTPGGWVGNLSRGSANLYRVNGGILTFKVKASGDGPETQYQCRIKLLNWDTQLTNPNANENTAATNALNGPIKVDCNCARHQYWYRYLANVGGYSLAPPVEKDFPKIKNPGLTGTVCKHTIAVFQVIRTPTYKTLIAQKMKSQRKAMGSGVKGKAGNLKRAELDALSKSKPRKTDQAKFKSKIESALKKALETKKDKAALKAEVRKLKAREVKLETKVKAQEAQIKKMEKARKSLGRKTREGAKDALSTMVSNLAEQSGMTELEAKAFIVSQLSPRNKE